MMRILLLLLISILSIAVQAQGVKYHTEDKKALKYYEEARQFLKRSQFREAMEPLQDAMDRDAEFIEVWLAFGSAYYRIGRDSLALHYLHGALGIDPDYRRSLYAYFVIGETYFGQADYQLAIDYLEHYLSIEGGDARNRDLSRDMIYSARFALKAMDNPFEYNIHVMADSANYFQLQYFPVLSVDQQTLYFTRRTGLQVNHDEDIYYASRINDGWSQPRSISPMINSEYNEGAASLSADGRALVFTSCDGRRGFGSCDIYISYKQGDQWSKPENMGNMINSASWEAQPSLSADGRTIYFVSNRPYGYGGKDIWSATKDKDGQWDMAINLGREINTKKDEISPFIHANGETLYFSSNGLEGLGGLDIYMSEWMDSTWTDPVNLGYPLNDAHDQVSLYISSDGTNGCYTIEKEEKGVFESKLYAFDLPDSFRVTHESAYLKGNVTDAKTGKPLGAKIKIYQLNNESYFSKLASDTVNGEYTIVLTEGNQYGIYVECKGYLFADFSFSFDELIEFDVQILDVQLTPIDVGASVVLGNIFYGFDEHTLKRESISQLRTVYNFLRANPDVSVEIAGHTDNTGSAQYNLELSEKRAKSVYDFMIFKRIKKKQISYKGYGQANPIAPNDNLENQAKNRRIEFKISRITLSN